MSDITEARVEAAGAIRALVQAFSAHAVDDDTLRSLTEAVRAQLPSLEAAPRRTRAIPSFAEMQEMIPAPGEPRTYAMADRAVVGPANPTSVEVETRRLDEHEGVAEVTFGPAFEGALGRVHGGMVAAVFDDLAGFVLGFVGRPGFSARLEVAFRAPVPTEVPIEFRVRLREQHGRKLLVEGEARLDGQVLATAETMMITVDQGHFETHARQLLTGDGG
jgi:acyl-coenzyme A thioesterase PaaI-like protein